MTDTQSQTPAPGKPEPKGFSGMFQDPSTLASTGLLIAALFAIVAGLFNVADSSGASDLQSRLLALTDTVDVGDVAIIGIAVALLLVTPDPPGGVPRHLLLQASALLAGTIMVYGVIRAVVLLVQEGSFLFRFNGFVATLGVALAAFTVAFYAAKESFLKAKAEEAAAAAAAAAA